MPPATERKNLLSGINSVMLPSSAQDFTDVPLAYKESASEFLDVTLAQEDDRLGVLIPDRSCEFYFYRLTLTRK